MKRTEAIHGESEKVTKDALSLPKYSEQAELPAVSSSAVSVRPITTEQQGLAARISLRQRVATVEGWLGMGIALLCWVYALGPIGPMVGMPVEAFIRDITPLFPAVIAIGFAVSGIRLGNQGARVAGALAVALLLPLIVLVIAVANHSRYL